MNFFERFYNRFIIFKSSPPKPLKKKYEFNLWLNRLKTTPENIWSSTFSFLIFSILFSITFLFLNYELGISILISSLFVYFYLVYFPIFYTQVVRIEVTSESIWVTIFLVLFLKRNPNVEKGIEYVSNYLRGNIADDFRSILIDLMNKKYQIVDDAISDYSKRWYYLNPDFVYVMVNILSIRRISDENQINRILDRILNWMINRAKQRSEDYVSKLKNPSIAILTFFIMMPLVSLIMLPIISIFLANSVSIAFIAFGYIIILPIISFLIIQTLLSRRPFAFSIPDLSLVKDLPRKGYFRVGNKEIPIFIVSWSLAAISIIGIYHMIMLGLSILHADNPQKYTNIVQQERSLGNVFLTLTFPLGIGLALGSYFYLNSFQRIKRAEEIEEMENEFPLVVYELANILDEGYPLEVVFNKTYYNYKIIKSSGVMERFLYITMVNLRRGYDVFSSIFDKNVGSINYYPSKIIREALYIIMSSSHKGPIVLAQISYNISQQLENIVNVRDLIRKTLNEVTSLLETAGKSIIPFMSGLVTVFNFGVVALLISLAYFFQIIDMAFGLYGSASLAQFIIDTFNLYSLIPPSVFAVIIGIYFIESVIIASFFASGIKYGFEKTTIYYSIGRNLLFGTVFYFAFSLIGLVVVNMMFGPFMPTPSDLVG